MSDATLPHREALEVFVDRVEDAELPDVQQLVLFGSVAQATHRPDSDVDVLAILEDSADVASVEDRLREIAYEVMLDHGVVFSIHGVTESTVAARNDHPFFERVLTEGQSIYG